MSKIQNAYKTKKFGLIWIFMGWKWSSRGWFLFLKLSGFRRSVYAKGTKTIWPTSAFELGMLEVRSSKAQPGQPQCNDSPTFWQIMYQFVAVCLVPKTLVLPKPPGQDQCVASTCPKVLLSLVLNSLALSHNKAVLHKRKTHSESSSAAGIQRMPLLCSSQVRSYLLKQVVLQLSWVCQAGPTDNT